jgi:hypothetical protein
MTYFYDPVITPSTILLDFEIEGKYIDLHNDYHCAKIDTRIACIVFTFIAKNDNQYFKNIILIFHQITIFGLKMEPIDEFNLDDIKTAFNITPMLVQNKELYLNEDGHYYFHIHIGYTYFNLTCSKVEIVAITN